MKILKIKITDITPNSFNPNEMEERQYKKLIHKIKSVGYTQPIEVRLIKNGQYEVVDGYHRYKACKELGMKDIECVISEYNDEQAKIENIAKNKIRGLSDPTKLALIIAELSKTKSIKELEIETGLDSLEIKDALELMEIARKSMAELKEKTSLLEQDKMLLIDFAVTPEQKILIETAVKTAMGQNKTNKRGEALVMICKTFLA